MIFSPNEGDSKRVTAGEPILDLPPLEGALSRVYAFLDVDDPIVAWAVYRCVLVSANAEFTPPQCPISMMFAGIVCNQNNIRLRNELLIEKYRQLHFPHCNSRLTGMYFFEDRQSAERVQRAPEWGGGHFCSENLAELLFFSSAPISRYDSNWITFAPREQSGKISDEGWIKNYWSGEPFPEKEPLWELVAQGRAVVCGADIRVRAYETVHSHFPEAVSLLEIARIAAHVGSDLGHLSAWLIRNEDASLDLRYHIDMRDADNPVFLDKVRRYSGPRNERDLAVGGDHFGIPHFEKCKCEFNVTDEFLLSVHGNK